MAFTERSAAVMGGIQNSGSTRFAPAPGTATLVDLGPDLYYVVSSDDLLARTDIVGRDGTAKTDALNVLGSYIRTHPDERGDLIVVPQYEAVLPPPPPE